MMAFKLRSTFSVLVMLPVLITTCNSKLTSSHATESQSRAVLRDTTPDPPLRESEHRADLSRREDVLSGIELRIQPLGDSITFGFQSSDGNGYRLPLQKLLLGSDTNFIGSVQSGNMTDNNNEGHNGATINQIAGFANLSLPERPNIVLLHAGTNDLNNDPPAGPYAEAPERLGALIDGIGSECPDATILVAQIINAANSSTESRILEFNKQVPRVVFQRAKTGRHVRVVDMRSITTKYLKDGLHPTDAGYEKMGEIWFQGIKDAAHAGLIHAPVNVSTRTNEASTTTPASASGPSSISGASSNLASSIWYPALSCGLLAGAFF